jgi:WD40 repeat protein
MTPGPAAVPPSPYKGLVPYAETDWPLFKGRDAEREIIAANLLANRFTILFAGSGVGKSSVLRAGVIHDLDERARAQRAAGEDVEAVAVYFASWRGDPLPGLFQRIAERAEAFAKGPAAADAPAPRTLRDALAQASQRTGAEILLVLDQFEEYFTYRGDEDGEGTFAAQLPRAVSDPRLPASFLLSLREDALGRLDRFKSSIVGLYANRIRLEQLGEAGARAAIVEPVAWYDANRAADQPPVALRPSPDALAAAVIEEVRTDRALLSEEHGRARRGEGPAAPLRVEAPFLQLVMTRLWEDGAARGAIDVEALARLGGAEKIVRAHLVDRLAGLSPEERAGAARLFRHLVTPSGSKVAHCVRDLADYSTLAPELVQRIVDRLASPEARILRAVPPAPDEPEPATRYEIFHDVLARSIRDWRLAFAREEAAREFDREREEAATRLDDERRRRRMVVRLGAALVVATALVSLQAFQTRAAKARAEHATQQAQEALGDAERARRRAEELAVAAAATLQVELDPQLALALTQQALSAPNDGPRAPELMDVARRALAADRALAILVEKGPPLAGAAPCGVDQVAVVGRSDEAVRLLRTASPDPPVRSVALARGAAWALSSDCVLVTAAPGDGWTAVNLRSGRRLASAGATSPIWKIATSGDGARIATAGPDAAVVWNARTGARERTFATAPGEFLTAVALDTTGTSLAVASRRRAEPDGRLVHAVVVRDVTTGVELRTLSGRSGRAADFDRAAFSPDGRWLAASGGRAATVWNLGTSDYSELFGHDQAITGLVFSPTGRTLATASADGTARIWDPTRGRELDRVLGHSGPVTSVAFTPDGARLVTGSWDGTVRLWDASGHAGPVIDLAFVPDGLLSAGRDGVVKLWDPATGRARRTYAVSRGRSERLLDLSTSADGAWFAAAGSDGTVWVWRTAGGAARGKAVPGAFPLVGAVISPDARRVLATTVDGRVHEWSLETGRWRSARLPGSRPGALVQHALAFDPRGRWIAAVSETGLAALLDPRTLRPLGPAVETHREFVFTVKASASGVLATASADGTVRLWTAALAPRASPALVHRQPVAAVSFAQDGVLVATGSWDRTAAVWEIEGKRLLTVSHSDPLVSVALDARGGMLATATARDVRPELHQVSDEAVEAAVRARTLRALTPEQCQELLRRPCSPPRAGHSVASR